MKAGLEKRITMNSGKSIIEDEKLQHLSSHGSGAIEQSEDHRFIPIIKVTIGNYLSYRVQCLVLDPTQWNGVINATRSKLDTIAEKGEQKYSLDFGRY